MRRTVFVTVCLLAVYLFLRSPSPADDGPQRKIDTNSLAEVVNGFAVLLSAESRASGEPVLNMRFINAGTEPFDVVELGPMFLEVEGPNRQWRSYQHSEWASDKVDDAHTFDIGHVDPEETERVSRFRTLTPGKHRVRVAMAIDSGMVRGYKSDRLWTGIVRSNVVEITVPKQRDGEK